MGSNMTTVGFIGLGSMGLPMAKNLAARGFRVRGFDIRPAALDACRKPGIARVLRRRCGRRGRCLRADGGERGAGRGGPVPGWRARHAPGEWDRGADGDLSAGRGRRHCGRVVGAGRRFVDAPVSGRSGGAVAGTLTIMAAAPKATFEATRPVLTAMGDKVFHVGESPGQGAMVKTVNQLFCGVHIAVAAEAFSLAAKVGVDMRSCWKSSPARRRRAGC